MVYRKAVLNFLYLPFPPKIITSPYNRPGIELAGHDLLDLVEHLDGHVPGPGSDLEHCVCVPQGGLKTRIYTVYISFIDIELIDKH